MGGKGRKSSHVQAYSTFVLVYRAGFLQRDWKRTMNKKEEKKGTQKHTRDSRRQVKGPSKVRRQKKRASIVLSGRRYRLNLGRGRITVRDAEGMKSLHGIHRGRWEQKEPSRKSTKPSRLDYLGDCSLDTDGHPKHSAFNETRENGGERSWLRPRVRNGRSKNLAGIEVYRET